MTTISIYALSDPRTGRAQYIGKAKNPHSRYAGHLADSRREKTPKANWIRTLLILGQVPILEVLDVVPETEWCFWEKEWIRLYRGLGFDLMNSNDGGCGGTNPTAATREKIGAPHRGKIISPQHRKKISVAHTGKWVSSETRARLSTALKGKPAHPANIAAVKAANTGSKRTPEVLEKMRVAQRNRRAGEREKS